MPDTETVWLSQKRYHELQEELEHLRTRGRAEASEAIERAREHGDISENAEYEVAKEEQGKLEARIREVERTLARAKVGEPAEAGDTVAVGNVVVIEDDDGDELRVLLGSREDKLAGTQVVSPQSPLGKALLDAKIGDTVAYDAPVGEQRAVIKAIELPSG